MITKMDPVGIEPATLLCFASVALTQLDFNARVFVFKAAPPALMCDAHANAAARHTHPRMRLNYTFYSLLITLSMLREAVVIVRT